MKYHLISLGCQMNLADTERIESVLESMGLVKSNDEEGATLLGVIACSVRQRAIDKVYARIQRWNSWKNRKNLLTFVSGCILPKDEVKFLKLFDLVLKIDDVPRLPDLIRQYGVITPLSEQAFPDVSFWDIRPHYHSSSHAYVPVQNGCDKFCTFCAVPYTRGREISRPSGAILEETGRLLTRGYASITLLGQNVNSYGLDRSGNELSFADLLREVGRMGGEADAQCWIYFTSPHPADMTDEVLDVIAEYPCLADQIHLPLQSGDDRVLIRMNRNYSLEQYRKTVHGIRRILPEATISTDIIVGFAGETDEQFAGTVRAMREFQFNMAYIALYSPRPGATSARWPDDVSHERKKERLQILSEELKTSSLAQNRRMVGTTRRVLVEGKDRKNGYLTGRTEGRVIVRFAATEERLIGRFVSVMIDSASPLSVEGVLAFDRLPIVARDEITEQTVPAYSG